MNGSRSDGSGPCRRVFVNPSAKDKKRCWHLPVTHRFLSALKKEDTLSVARFIINAPPETERRTAALFRDHPVDGVALFTAHEICFNCMLSSPAVTWPFLWRQT